jgi:zinc protease
MIALSAGRGRAGLAIACACLALSLPATAQAPPADTQSPTVDQILDRYLQAEGGRAAFQKLNSRVMTGTVRVPSMSLVGTVEFRAKAPNRSLGVVTINDASFRQGFDGTAGWTDDPQNGLRVQAGAELEEARRESDFYHTLDLHKLYLGFTLAGKEKVGDHDAYVIEAALPEGGPPEKMYFDTQSGLLLRDSSRHHGPDGVSELQQDYEDYRQVDGIELPHTIRQTNEGALVIITVAEYHHNVQLDDAQFAKPAAP